MRNLLLLKINDWKWVKSKVTLSAILVLLTAVTVYTWAGWLSLLPLLSVGITSIGYWTNNAQKIRLSQMLGSPCTLVYDALIHSWGGAMNEAIAAVVFDLIACIGDSNETVYSIFMDLCCAAFCVFVYGLFIVKFEFIS